MISAGATEVHSGPTSYRFKVDTGHALIPMTTYVKHLVTRSCTGS